MSSAARWTGTLVLLLSLGACLGEGGTGPGSSRPAFSRGAPATSPEALPRGLPWRAGSGAPPPGVPPRAPGGVPGATTGSPGPVLLVSIDGLRPDALVRAPAPRLLALLATGAYSFRAQTISPSVTLPSHASMVSGFLPAEHGLLHNDVQPGYIHVTTVFTVAKAARRRVALVVGKEKLEQLAPPESRDVFAWAPGGDAAVVERALDEARSSFDLLFVHLPDVDIAGHTYGWLSAEYLERVAAADAALSRLLDALPAGTRVLVSADHGGHDFNHHQGTEEDATIPWILAGPGVRRGHALTQPISTVDTAATIARLLGLSLPPGAVGKPVDEAFAP